LLTKSPYQENGMTSLAEIENQATLARVTCGWKKPGLDLALVRPYWRDAHSPAIARRRGIYEYRHYPLDPIRADVFGAVSGIDFAGKPDEQLMWLSDVRYADEAGLQAFSASPDPAVRAQMLADIEMIVDQSTTYKVIGRNGRTLLDNTGEAAPAGPARRPTYGVFFRQRGTEAAFRATLEAMAVRWTTVEGVRRVRLSLFEVPDMAAERASGYPVKTHPVPLQYQAWIDLAVDDSGVCKRILPVTDVEALRENVQAIHAYPAPAVYTFNYRGQPTLTGLRGYAAHAAIESLNAKHQTSRILLEWMYGPIAGGAN
jgi:hypothetical protein